MSQRKKFRTYIPCNEMLDDKEIIEHKNTNIKEQTKGVNLGDNCKERAMPIVQL